MIITLLRRIYDVQNLIQAIYTDSTVRREVFRITSSKRELDAI